MRRRNLTMLALTGSTLSVACAVNPAPAAAPAAPERELTLGLVQREVKSKPTTAGWC